MHVDFGPTKRTWRQQFKHSDKLPHRQLNQPGCPWLLFGLTIKRAPCSGQAAALAGGTTMHIDFALPIDGDLAEGFARYQQAAARSVMDYSFHMAVTSWNDKASSIYRANVPGATGAEV